MVSLSPRSFPSWFLCASSGCSLQRCLGWGVQNKVKIPRWVKASVSLGGPDPPLSSERNCSKWGSENGEGQGAQGLRARTPMLNSLCSKPSIFRVTFSVNVSKQIDITSLLWSFTEGRKQSRFWKTKIQLFSPPSLLSLLIFSPLLCSPVVWIQGLPHTKQLLG